VVVEGWFLVVVGRGRYSVGFEVFVGCGLLVVGCRFGCFLVGVKKKRELLQLNFDPILESYIHYNVVLHFRDSSSLLSLLRLLLRLTETN